ncbi:MAG: hypothetical protein ACRC8A_12900 [Microcoleaceae cyanobacterium]
MSLTYPNAKKCSCRSTIDFRLTHVGSFGALAVQACHGKLKLVFCDVYGGNMPEADLPPSQPSDKIASADQGSGISNFSRALGSTQSSRPIINPLGSNQGSDWETVTFPNATNVDHLPIAIDPSEDGGIFQERTMSEHFQEPVQALGSIPPNESSTQLVQALHDCNRDLISRVTELEAELENCQNALQEKDSLLSQRSQDFELAQDQVARLFGKLELSNQVIRRQQVLVETLTEQWETSQARMAQLERECVAAQQRYNEQFNDLVQAQSTAQELRSRLHRQQRHTLQFKAALERCLEMQPEHIQMPTLRHPATSISPQVSTSGLGELELVDAEFMTHDVAPATPRLAPISLLKTEPVQPWSAHSTGTELGRLGELARLEIQPDSISFTLEDPLENPLAEDLASLEHPVNNLEETGSTGSVQSISPNDLVTLEAYWHIESSTQPFLTEAEFVNIKPILIEDELDQIRLKYASEDTSALPPSLNSPYSDLQTQDIHPLAPIQPDDVSNQESALSNKIGQSPWQVPLLNPQRQSKLASLAAIKLPIFPNPSRAEVLEQEAEQF